MVEQWNQIVRAMIDRGAQTLTLGEWTGVARLDDPAREYEAASRGLAVTDRSHRGLLEITGPDRASWLNNLITNKITTLQPGEGHYAFAINVKGRILFDLNVLVRTESLWLDLDARWIIDAKKHLEKYVIVEDVQITDRSDAFVRLALMGQNIPQFLSRCGVAQTASAPLLQLGLCPIAKREVPFFRDDPGGAFGLELLVPAEDIQAVWDALRADENVSFVGYDALDTLRMEAGIPWPFTEITSDVLPAETRQLHRAVNFNKGCYLGQEIVERMRSRQSLSRQLVLLRFDGQDCPSPGATLFADDRKIGQVTSARHSPANDAFIALGYARTAHAADDTTLRAEWDSTTADCKVIPIQQAH